MALLSVRSLTRAPWWRNVTFELEASSHAVLRGPSGSGKTLLLRAIADLDPVDGGEVRLAGRLREEFTPAQWRRRVRYVHQGAVRLEGSVAENIAAISSLLGVPPEPAADLDPAADAKHLSGGEAQRLALQRALLGSPDVLLLDEVTAALDEPAARELEGRVRTYVAEGRAALWVSHDPSLARRLGALELHPW